MDTLKTMQTYLREWLAGHREAVQIAPAVQDALDEVDWQVQILDARPPEATIISTSQIDDEAAVAFDHVVTVLPQMPRYDVSMGLRVNSITTSSGFAAQEYVSQVSDLGTPTAVAYADAAVESYRRLQEAHERPQRIRTLLAARFPTLLDEFDEAQRAYQQVRLGTGENSSAALAMRNVVDRVQGELFERARRFPKENMTWVTMSGRLTTDSAGESTVASQARARSALYGDLSDVAKARGARSIEHLWARTLDHLFVVLTETR